jgi:membrane protein required for colicin V production
MGSLPMNDILSINQFDAAVYIGLFVAVVMGFMSGLLRSMATIFGYVAAMSLAVALAPQLAPVITAQLKLPPAQTWLVFGGIFLGAGMLISALLRLTVSEMACWPC